MFTSKDFRPDVSTPFLDILITPNVDGSLSTTVYRKLTHTAFYLQWDSHHTVASKYSMVGILHERVHTICSSPQLLQQEEQYLQKALQKCKYPACPLNRVKIKTKGPANNKSRRDATNSSSHNNQKPHMLVLYYKGLSENLKKVCSKHGVQVYFKGGNTIKNL